MPSLKRCASDAALPDRSVTKRKFSTPAGILSRETHRLQFNTERNRTQSPLLRIPGELRNRIYSYALGGIQVTPFATKCDKSASWHSHCTNKSKWHPPVCLGRVHGSKRQCYEAYRWDRLFKLSLVCRQLHSETRLLPYVFSQFQFINKTWPIWVRALRPEQRRSIRHVEYIGDCHNFSLRYLSTLELLSGLKTVEFEEDLRQLPQHIIIAFSQEKGWKVVVRRTPLRVWIDEEEERRRLDRAARKVIAPEDEGYEED